MRARLLYATGLLILIGTAAMRLPGPLSPLEGHQAARVLAAFDGDGRSPEPPLHRGRGALLAAWCATAGTGEPALRGAPAAALLLAVLLLAPGLPRSAAAFAAACGVFALSGLFHGENPFDPGLVAVLPAAALLGASRSLRPGGGRTAILAALGGLLGALAGGRGELAAAALAAAVPLALPASGAAPRFRFAILAAGGLLAGRLLLPGSPFGSPEAPLPGEAGLLDLAPSRNGLALAAWAAALAGAAGFALFRKAAPAPAGAAEEGRNAAGLRGPLICLAAAVAALLAPWNGRFELRGADYAALLAPFAFAAASLVHRAPRPAGGVAAAVLLAGAALAAGRPRSPEIDAPAILLEARAFAESGGRLVLWDRTRFLFLHYTRRGGFPMVPVLLAPEDGALREIVESLPERLGGRAPGPRVLFIPPVEDPFPFIEEFRTSTGIQAAKLGGR